MQIEANNVHEEALSCPNTPGQIIGVPLPNNDSIEDPDSKYRNVSRIVAPSTHSAPLDPRGARGQPGGEEVRF